MTEDRWAEILRSAPSAATDGWQVLPENGLGALIAYAAGPGRARPHAVPLSERRVRVTVTRGGRSEHRTEPMTPDDLATIASVVADHLADAGLPPPPCTWWEVDLPGGTTADELCARLHAHAAAVPGHDVGVARARLEARAVLDEAEALFRGSS